MNPIYKFTLAVGSGTPSQAFPVYGDDLAKVFERESNQMFFRAKLNGTLTFINEDFATIDNASFDDEFKVVLYISYDGTTWDEYWKGKFFKTDCDFDEDDERVDVTPSPDDDYDVVMAGMDKEFNLIDLAPVRQEIRLDKRPMFQVYVPGQTTLGCILSGMWWEEECDSVLETDTVLIDGVTKNKLTDYLHFAKCTTQRSVKIESGDIPVSSFVGAAPPDADTGWSMQTDDYVFTGGKDERDGHTYYEFTIYHEVGGSLMPMWECSIVDPVEPPTVPLELLLSPISGSGATGDILVLIMDIPVYSRMVLDKSSFKGNDTYALPYDDISAENRNYHYCYDYELSDYLYFTARLVETPTKWGIYQPGKYYVEPDDTRDYLPVGKNDWGVSSVWISPYSSELLVDEEDGRSQFVLKDAFTLSSTIAVLLGKIAPSITHQGNAAYSQFLYSTNPLTGETQELFVSPKSNLVTAGYDQPAQKAPIKLGDVMEMLRDCYRCYWFLDNGKFRIEHVQFFKLGGSYSGTPSVGIDLTQSEVTRNGKKWAFSTSRFRYDKPEMAARYQFAWMDDVLDLFEGYPIEIVSKYVNQENVQNVQIGQFTSDVDYILLNPSAVSRDGFVLLSAQYVAGGGYYILPYYDYVPRVGVHQYLQNGYASFVHLQQFYFYDMPAWTYAINGVEATSLGVKKLKRQTLNFPTLFDPDLLKLVKTFIGDGEFQKISINLSSRNANVELMYDTEQ